MKIYLLIGEEQRGPYSPDMIRKMLSDQEITLETLFWEEGMPEWQALGKRTDLRPAPVTIAPPRRPQTGDATVDFKDALRKNETLSARRKPITIGKAVMALTLFFGVLTLFIYIFEHALPDASKKNLDEASGVTSYHQ